MNASSSVISVNPRKASVGSLHSEAAAGVLRRVLPVNSIRKGARALSRTCSHTPGASIRVLLGVGKKTSNVGSLRLLLFRFLFSGMLAFTAWVSSSPLFDVLPMAAWWGICIALTVGCFQRITSWTVSGYFAIAAVSSYILTPEFNTEAAMTSILAAVLACSGPGRFSFDFLSWRCIYKAAVRKALKRKEGRRPAKTIPIENVADK